MQSKEPYSPSNEPYSQSKRNYSQPPLRAREMNVCQKTKFSVKRARNAVKIAAFSVKKSPIPSNLSNHARYLCVKRALFSVKRAPHALTKSNIISEKTVFSLFPQPILWTHAAPVYQKSPILHVKCVSKEPYSPCKEPYMLLKSRMLYHKSPVLRKKSPILHKKSPALRQKRPNLHQMSRILQQKSPSLRGKEPYSHCRIRHFSEHTWCLMCQQSCILYQKSRILDQKSRVLYQKSPNALKRALFSSKQPEYLEPDIWNMYIAKEKQVLFSTKSPISY